MRAHETPDNLIELLNGVIRAAARTAFFSPILGGVSSISTVEEFRAISVTPLSIFRARPMRDTLSEPRAVDWIVGASDGQSPALAAIAESAEEGSIRYDLIADAVKECVDLNHSTVCVVVSTSARRYFASEVATILIAAGAQAHVFTGRWTPRAYERLELLEPTVAVVLSPGVVQERIPASVKLIVSFDRECRLDRFPQMDVYHVDGLGFLGQSVDMRTYSLNGDVYHFERSVGGNLIVTPLHARVQPALRIMTEDRVEFEALGRIRFL